MAKKRLDNWHARDGGVNIEGWKVGAANKPTRILPKQAKLKALDRSLHTSNDYAKMHPVVDAADPIPVAMQYLRKKP